MARLDAALMAPLQDGMGGDQRAVLEDPDLVGQGVNLDGAAPGGVGHGIRVAADADHSFPTDASLELQDRTERRQRQRSQRCPLLAKPSVTTSRVVACVRGLATVSSQ